MRASAGGVNWIGPPIFDELPSVRAVSSPLDCKSAAKKDTISSNTTTVARIDVPRNPRPHCRLAPTATIWMPSSLSLPAGASVHASLLGMLLVLTAWLGKIGIPCKGRTLDSCGSISSGASSTPVALAYARSLRRPRRLFFERDGMEVLRNRVGDRACPAVRLRHAQPRHRAGLLHSSYYFVVYSRIPTSYRQWTAARSHVTYIVTYPPTDHPNLPCCATAMHS